MLTKFTFFSARKIRLAAVFFLVFGTSIFFTDHAEAESAWTTVICGTNAGNQQSFQIGWDNSNQFFADKGYIPRLYCEGGYAGNYRTYISDTLNGSPLGYFQGVVPVVVEPTPVVPSDTSTATVDTGTAQTDTETATVDTSTSQSSGQETQTSQTETPTVTPEQTDSSTVPSDTSTNTAPVDGSTATSEPAPPPPPAPTPPPAVEPEPPVVAPPPPEEEPAPPAEAEAPPEEAPEPPVEAEEPPPVAEEPPVEAEEPPAIAEEPPAEEEEPTVTLDNGVVLTQEQAVAVALLQDPVALVQELFTNPAAALAALSEVGADMSPEVREESEKVIISAVIAGNIATQAAASAGAVAAYRRKP